MKTSLLTVVAAGFLMAQTAPAAEPKTHRSSDMQRAIAFERYKDMASARQARKEAVHPSVTYSSADRRIEEPQAGNPVKDPGPKGRYQDR